MGRENDVPRHGVSCILGDEDRFHRTLLPFSGLPGFLRGLVRLTDDGDVHS